MSYLLAGSTSSNPVMFVLAIGLILGWRVAGHIGVDRTSCPGSASRGGQGDHPGLVRGSPG